MSRPDGDGAGNGADRDELDVLAAEYAAGLLDAAQMRAAERQMDADPAFAKLVWTWRSRLAPLDDAAPVVVPAPELWARIEEAIGRPAPTAPARAAAGTAVRDEWPGRFLGERLRRMLGDARAWQAATGLAVAALLLALLPSVRPSEGRPVAAAVLQGADQVPVYLVEVFADRSLRVKPLGAVPVAEQGRSLQFWTLRDRQEGPLSLGLLPAAGLDRVGLGGLPLPLPGQLFEVTVEPFGGSPTGRPTGTILGKGLTAAL